MLILKTIASLLENSYKNENKNKLKYEEYWCKNKTKHRISSLILINNISTKPSSIKLITKLTIISYNTLNYFSFHMHIINRKPTNDTKILMIITGNSRFTGWLIWENSSCSRRQTA